MALTVQAATRSHIRKCALRTQLCALPATPTPEFLFCLHRYKKNIKALYIVHPTMIIKTLLILFKPIIR